MKIGPDIFTKMKNQDFKEGYLTTEPKKIKSEEIVKNEKEEVCYKEYNFEDEIKEEEMDAEEVDVFSEEKIKSEEIYYINSVMEQECKVNKEITTDGQSIQNGDVMYTSLKIDENNGNNHNGCENALNNAVPFNVDPKTYHSKLEKGRSEESELNQYSSIPRNNLAKDNNSISISVKQYQCAACQRCYGTKQHLKRHFLSVHIKLKPFKCSDCDYSFSQKGNLAKHVEAMHTKVKPFKCAECDFSGSFKSNLTQHINSVHNKLKPFECPECAYSSSLNSHLKIHVNSVHRKLKPFKCAECAYSCSKNGHLTRHIKSVHRKSNV